MPEHASDILVEGFYDWSPGVVVAAECLGRSFRSRLGDWPFEIEFPTVERAIGTILEPPTTYRRPSTWVNVDPPHPWGEVRISSTSEGGAIIVRTVAVKRVRIRVWISQTDAANGLIAQEVDVALASWWVALRSWIEVLTRQDLAELGNRKPVGPQTFHLWTGRSDGEMQPLPMVFTAKFFPEIDVLMAYGLEACLAAVVRREPPPQEWLHLRDAQSLHEAEEWRRSVIDAATAAELAVTAWLDRRLNDAEISVKSALLSQARTLGPLSQLYAKLDGVLPARFQDDLVAPRNRAAHRGSPLSQSESAAAIEAASSLLKAASPIELPPG